MELRHPESAVFVEGIITHWKDCTMYTVGKFNLYMYVLENNISN